MQAEKEVPGNTNALKGELAQLVKNSRGEVATTRTVETGAEMLMTDNIGIQQGDPEKNDIGVAIGTSTPNRKPRGCPRQPDVAEPTQTSDGAAQSAVPGASAEQPASSGPISSEADNTPVHGPTPPKAAADPEARNTTEAPLAPLADSSVPPPVPAKDTAVISMPSPASQETSTSTLQIADLAASEAVDPDKAGETVAPLSEEDAAAAAKSDNPDPEAVAKGPTAQSGADDIHTTGGGFTAAQGEDAKSEKPPRLTLPMDRLCLLSTATVMSSSGVETPADEAGSPAVGVGDGGGAGEPATPRRLVKGKKLKKKKGKKIRPCPAYGGSSE